MDELPEKVELRNTQTERGIAGGSRSSLPLTIDSTFSRPSSSSPWPQCDDVIPTLCTVELVAVLN